jgi:hypothetical protein
VHRAGTLHDRTELEKARAAVLGSTGAIPASPSRATSRQTSVNERHSGGPFHPSLNHSIQGAATEAVSLNAPGEHHPGAGNAVPDVSIRHTARAPSLVRGDSAATGEAAVMTLDALAAPPAGLTSRGPHC